MKTGCDLGFFRSMVAALVAMMLATPASAQTSRGTVAGTVMDVSGGAIPGTTVELTHTATGVIRSAITNDAGIYRFDAVDLGEYHLKIARPGLNFHHQGARCGSQSYDDHGREDGSRWQRNQH